MKCEYNSTVTADNESG